MPTGREAGDDRTTGGRGPPKAARATPGGEEPGISASYGMDAGRFWLQCRADGRAAARRDAMFDMTQTAFRLLEGAYPEHVRLIDDLCQDMVEKKRGGPCACRRCKGFTKTNGLS